MLELSKAPRQVRRATTAVHTLSQDGGSSLRLYLWRAAQHSAAPLLLLLLLVARGFSGRGCPVAAADWTAAADGGQSNGCAAALDDAADGLDWSQPAASDRSLSVLELDGAAAGAPARDHHACLHDHCNVRLITRPVAHRGGRATSASSLGRARDAGAGSELVQRQRTWT